MSRALTLLQSVRLVRENFTAEAIGSLQQHYLSCPRRRVLLFYASWRWARPEMPAGEFVAPRIQTV